MQAVLCNETYRNNESVLTCNDLILTLKSQLGKLIVKMYMLHKHPLILCRTPGKELVYLSGLLLLLFHCCSLFSAALSMIKENLNFMLALVTLFFQSFNCSCLCYKAKFVAMYS